MNNLRLTLIGVFTLLLYVTTYSQTLPNSKNVDRTAMSYFDGPQTFKALEYTLTQYPQSTKVVFLNGEPIANPHVITVDFVIPGPPFNEWQNGFQFADIILDVK